MHPASWPTYLSQDRWRSGHSTVDGFRMSGCSVTGALALALAPRATEFSVTFLEDGDERCGSLSEMWSVRFERVACRRLRDRRAGRTDGGHIDPLARGWRRRGVDRPVQPSGPPQLPRPGPGHPGDPARLKAGPRACSRAGDDHVCAIGAGPRIDAELGRAKWPGRCPAQTAYLLPAGRAE